MSPVTWTEREYIHGPGYVDEYICQIDGFGRLAYILQDANYNVIAQANDDGEVIEQLLWSPYGELLARESYLTFGLNKVGHQGLIFDRFDVSVMQAGLAMPTSGAPPDGLYYNRNRSYSARLGRFVQADPNSLGGPIARWPAFHGGPIPAATDTIAIERLYVNGMSLYQALGSSPLMRNDPLGLFFLLSMATADGFRAELRDQQIDVGLSVASSLLSGVLSGASVHALMIDALADSIGGGRNDRAIDGLLANFNNYISNATDATKKFNKHHVIPKFLGGAKDGALEKLTRAEHNHFHRLLNQALEDHGLPRTSTMKTADWHDYLREGNRAQRAQDALIDASRRFDRLYDKQLTSSVRAELMAQGGAGGLKQILQTTRGLRSGGRRGR
jgi:hypothetical protein